MAESKVEGDKDVKTASGGGVTLYVYPCTYNEGKKQIEISFKVTGGVQTKKVGNKSEKVQVVDHFEVEWQIDTYGTFQEAGTTTVKCMDRLDSSGMIHYAFLALRDDTDGYQAKVTAVSKTYESGGKTTNYFSPLNRISKRVRVPLDLGGGGTGGGSGSGSGSDDTLSTPSAPNVSIKDYQLTVETTTSSSEIYAEKARFEIVADNRTIVKDTTVPITQNYASVTIPIEQGKDYKARVMYQNNSGVLTSDWSDFSSNSKSAKPPATPYGIMAAASSATEVKVTWSAVSDAKGYDIEYATDAKYFDTSSATQSISVKSTTGFVTGLEAGRTWYFRVRSTNDDGESGWSNVVSVLIGKPPAAPTTWSRTTTAIAGENVRLYWVHNSRDNSKMTAAILELTLNDNPPIQQLVAGPDSEDDPIDTVHSHLCLTDGLNEGLKLKWRVQTKGAVAEFGDWSIMREITIYAPPTCSIELQDRLYQRVDTLRSLPLRVKIESGPRTQNAVTYSIAIISNNTYQTLANDGTRVWIYRGQEVFSRVYNADDGLSNIKRIDLSAGDLTLENDMSYTVKVVVGMNSGLSATNETTFTVDWENPEYSIDASIGIDYNDYSAQITPYAVDAEGEPYRDALLTVYRRDYDGSFTEIIREVDSAKPITTIDPHVTLDYAKYRVVSKSKSTGAIMYYDLPPIPIHYDHLIIQWDEAWSDFLPDEVGEEPFVEPVHVGSTLKIRGNIDISDNYDPEVTLINYIGRKHPVSYYGTQRGVTTNWSAAIPKEDVETLYLIRRLAVWNGDVYVREPSGTGYWANIKVSYSRKHVELIIPVSFSITRVEGGE